MKKYVLMSLLIVLAFNIRAQEEATTTTTETAPATVTEESAATTETETTEIAEETPATKEVKENWVACDTAYLNYARGLPAAQQTKEFENWWMYADYDYRTTKNDEFKYREEKPKWEKEYKAKLASKEPVQAILLNVKLGTYDFKKKGFSVDIKLESDKTLANHYDGSFSMGGLGGPPSANLGGCSMRINDYKKAEQLPSSVKIKPTNVGKLKFIPVDEATAKKITAELGSSRVTTVTIRYQPGKTQYLKKRIGVFKSNELVTNAEVKELLLRADGQDLVFQF